MYRTLNRSQNDQELEKYLPLVKKLAHLLISRLPANVQVDDLIQAGLMGLVDALDRFDLGINVKFETFAGQRIRGAMLDELRATDWVPKNVRALQKKIEKILIKTQHEYGRHPTELEIARAMGVSLAQYQDMLFESRGAQLVYYEDYKKDEDSESDFLDRHGELNPNQIGRAHV